MKVLAAVFASIALLAALVGFGMNVLPILAQLGRIAAAIAMAGFAITAVTYVMEELIPVVAFEAADIHP